MKNALFVLGAGALLVLTLGVGGCQKPAPPPPTVKARPTPPPTPIPFAALLDGKDLDRDQLRAKANQAADSLGKYLGTQDPKMRAKFQRLSNKLVDRFGQDKDHWREKLEAKRRDLEPQIEKLRERLTQDGGLAGEKLREQLAELEKRSDTTDQKLSQLEAIGADAWKKFKAQLKDDESRERTPPVDPPAGGPES